MTTAHAILRDTLRRSIARTPCSDAVHRGLAKLAV